MVSWERDWVVSWMRLLFGCEGGRIIWSAPVDSVGLGIDINLHRHMGIFESVRLVEKFIGICSECSSYNGWLEDMRFGSLPFTWQFVMNCWYRISYRVGRLFEVHGARYWSSGPPGLCVLYAVEHVWWYEKIGWWCVTRPFHIMWIVYLPLAGQPKSSGPPRSLGALLLPS